MAFELPKLPYAYDALEPYIDARTMEIHHSKHHQAYTTNLNQAIAGTALENASIEEILASCKDLPAVRNNGGGYWNHNLFWEIMTPGGSHAPEGDLLNAIVEAYGSMDGFKDAFAKAATTRFGSGWAWLSVKDGKLVVSKTQNGESPLVHGAKPILGVDVWEHSYYIDYRNRRPDYLKAFVEHLINWDYVLEMYENATS